MKSSVRKLVQTLSTSFKARHYSFQERVSLQNIKQSSKHAAFLSVEVWYFFLFPLGFGNVGQKLQKLRKNLSISSMLSAHCPSVLASNSLYKTKKNMSMEVHDCLRHRVVFCFFSCFKFCVFYFPLDAKAEKQSADSIQEIDCV